VTDEELLCWMRRVDALLARMDEYLQRRRDALLAEVDTVERMRAMEPRTAELRRQHKCDRIEAQQTQADRRAL